ncbi:TetR/AcrR family transcriptional regulator [Hymenobacter psoromatis]|uniref:TetR/AcrR family transcriptional regulator n=1 Tax=Hymenobacter psoromatis TaxID=1484116 RepID=UPI001CBE542A|nr:TetR/AcrR family transcriptional regulator [Hymenobacter psoromatis]
MARPKAFDEEAALQKALDTFWLRGYAATSMQELVERMGINRFSLYATFGDKHQLYVRTLRHYQQQNSQRLLALAIANAGQPAPVRVRQMLELMLLPDPASPAPNCCFLVNATTERLPHDADIAALVRQNQQFLETLLTEILAQGQVRGETGRAATPLAQAQLLISVLNGMRIMAQANPDSQVLRNVVETVLLGLAAG